MQEQEVIRDQNPEANAPSNTSPQAETPPNSAPGADASPVPETNAFSQPAGENRNGQNVPPAAGANAANLSAEDEELFSRYEIKGWEYTPRLYKIFAVSFILNILFLVTVAQTNVLRAKACDSPLVNGFCQVLDTLYVGGKVLSADDEFASLPYERTELEDAEIVWVDQTGVEPPLTYPAGYFQIANPENYMSPDDPLAGFNDPNMPSVVAPAPPMPIPTSPNPTIPSTPNDSGVLNRPQKLPKSTKNPIIGELPAGINPNPTEDGTKDPKDAVAENKTEKPEPSKQPGINSVPMADDIINKKPLQDFGETVLDKVAKKEVDLSKEFSVVMVGTITDEGKFDPQKSAYVKSTGDQAMVDVAKSAIEAVGDSGILQYLKRLDVNQIKFELVQNDKEVYVIITSDQKSEQKAKSVASGLNTALSVGKMTVKKEDVDTMALLEASKVESQGRSFILNFKLDKPAAQEMIKRQLEKAEAKRKEKEQTKPSSTAQTVNNNANTSK